jgi:hypothetical protein
MLKARLLAASIVLLLSLRTFGEDHSVAPATTQSIGESARWTDLLSALADPSRAADQAPLRETFKSKLEKPEKQSDLGRVSWELLATLAADQANAELVQKLIQLRWKHTPGADLIRAAGEADDESVRMECLRKLQQVETWPERELPIDTESLITQLQRWQTTPYMD